MFIDPKIKRLGKAFGVCFVFIALIGVPWMWSAHQPLITQTSPNTGTPPVATAATGIDPKDLYIEFDVPALQANVKDQKGWSVEIDNLGPKDPSGRYLYTQLFFKLNSQSGICNPADKGHIVYVAYDHDYEHKIRLPAPPTIAKVKQFSVAEGKPIRMYNVWIKDEDPKK